jgi:hypothetical protein
MIEKADIRPLHPVFPVTLFPYGKLFTIPEKGCKSLSGLLPSMPRPVSKDLQPFLDFEPAAGIPVMERGPLCRDQLGVVAGRRPFFRIKMEKTAKGFAQTRKKC